MARFRKIDGRAHRVPVLIEGDTVDGALENSTLALVLTDRRAPWKKSPGRPGAAYRLSRNGFFYVSAVKWA